MLNPAPGVPSVEVICTPAICPPNAPATELVWKPSISLAATEATEPVKSLRFIAPYPTTTTSSNAWLSGTIFILMDPWPLNFSSCVL